jgi:hypothetical protein
MRGWLRSGATGCDFASRLGRDDTAFAVLFRSSGLSEVARVATQFVEQAADTKRVAIVTFPDASDDEAVADLLCAVCSMLRWHARPVEVANLPKDRAGIDLRWRIEDGVDSSVLGLGPSAMLPVTRRAPFFSLALWPLHQSSEHRRKPGAVVSIGDAPPNATGEVFARRLASTKQKVDAFRTVDPLAPANRSVTLYLPMVHASRVLASGR